MEFKPFPMYVGYNTKVTEYEHGKRGKGPTAEVMNWLAEVDIKWQFKWHVPEMDNTVSLDEYMKQTKLSLNEYMKLTKEIVATSGGTFYFDSEEDRLLFCLRWLSGEKNPKIIYQMGLT